MKRLMIILFALGTLLPVRAEFQTTSLFLAPSVREKQQQAVTPLQTYLNGQTVADQEVLTYHVADHSQYSNRTHYTQQNADYGAIFVPLQAAPHAVAASHAVTLHAIGSTSPMATDVAANNPTVQMRQGPDHEEEWFLDPIPDTLNPLLLLALLFTLKILLYKRKI